jgi:hypothetical protein
MLINIIIKKIDIYIYKNIFISIMPYKCNKNYESYTSLLNYKKRFHNNKNIFTTILAIVILKKVLKM